MAAPIAIVDLSAVSPRAAQPLLDALAARTEPGAVKLADDESAAVGLRWALGLLLLLAVPIAILGMMSGHRTEHDAQDGAIGIGMFLWIAFWSLLGPARLAWRRKRLPWKPGIYAIGPHVIDARRATLRFFALRGVSADADGERGSKPCTVTVESTWKPFTVKIKERATALRVRDQLGAAIAGDRSGDMLAPLVAPGAAAVAGAGAAPADPFVLRFAFLTAAVLAAPFGALFMALV